MLIHPLDEQNDILYYSTSPRPDSALDLLSDSDKEDDDKLDRISDILSTLIQEANEAVHTNDKKPYKPTSGIPMVRKLSSSSHSEQHHQKRRTSRVPVRPLSYPSIMRRSVTTPHQTMSNSSINSSNKMVLSSVKRQNPTENVLLESFKRLDSSLAMIDSLSRDLAPEVEPKETIKQPTTMIKKHSALSFDSRLSALLLLPLLHVPHFVVSMVFESITNSDFPLFATNKSNSSSLGGMFVWAFLFAITNLVVDKAIIFSPSINNNTVVYNNNNNNNNNNTKKELPGSFQRIRMRRKSHSKRMSHKRKLSSQHTQRITANALSMHTNQSPIKLTRRYSF